MGAAQLPGLELGISEATFAARVDTLKADPRQRQLLVELLREQHPVYAQRGTAATVRMRGWVLLALGHQGLPEAALLFVLEELDNGRDAYLVGAAARVLRQSEQRRAAFAPFLLRAISNIRLHDDSLCFDRYGAYATSDEGMTTALAELIETLRWLGPHARPVLPELEALLEAEGDGAHNAPWSALMEVAKALRGSPAEPAATDDCCQLPEGLGGFRLFGQGNRERTAALETVVLEDQDGGPVRFGDFFRGQPSIVAFFYTRCDNPQKCSLTVSKLARFQRLLAERNLEGRIRTAAITYDAGYDLPERLRAYGETRGVRMDGNHKLLRAREGADALRVHFNLGVNFIRSLVNRHRIEVYLLDGQGRVAGSFERIQWDEAELLKQAQALLDEGAGRAREAPPPESQKSPAAWPLVTALASVAAAFFPKCPVCWAAYLSVFGVAGLNQIPYSPWLRVLFAALLLVNLGSLWLRGRSQKRMTGFHLAATGSAAIIAGQLGLDLPFAGPVGVALTIAGSLVSALDVSGLREKFRALRSASAS